MRVGIQKTAPIKPGSTIGVFAPASPADPDKLNSGVAYLERLGFNIRLAGTPTQLYRSNSVVHSGTLFCSGSAKERAKALSELLEDNSVGAIIAARGGFGSIEVLEHLDFSTLKEQTKPVVGFSDVTALLVALSQFAGFPTIHGAAVAVEFAAADSNSDAATSASELLALLRGEEIQPRVVGRVLRAGRGAGRLVGGNLTTLLTLIGTPWEPSFDNSILFLEEVNEAPYRVYRALTQLRLAGKLSRLSGLIFGSLSTGDSSGFDELLAFGLTELFASGDYPIISGFPCGHAGVNFPVPLGCRAMIEDGVLRYLEFPVI